jgi:hypothetical protein
MAIVRAAGSAGVAEWQDGRGVGVVLASAGQTIERGSGDAD